MKKNDLSVFEIEKDGFRLKLQKGVGDQPTMTSTATPAVANGPASAGAAPPSAGSASLTDIFFPMVGTFFRAAAPDCSPFVDVGKKSEEGTVGFLFGAV